MANSDAMISMRLPSEIKARLEKAAERTRRSRSYLTVAALQKYLAEIEQEELNTVSSSKLDIALSFKGARKRAGGKLRTAKDIDTSIRDMRGDE